MGGWITFFGLVCGPSRQVCHCRAFAIPAARCSAVGLSAEQLTESPSAVMASAVVGPMAANWKTKQHNILKFNYIGSITASQAQWRYPQSLKSYIGKAFSPLSAQVVHLTVSSPFPNRTWLPTGWRKQCCLEHPACGQSPNHDECFWTITTSQRVDIWDSVFWGESPGLSWCFLYLLCKMVLQVLLQVWMWSCLINHQCV